MLKLIPHINKPVNKKPIKWPQSKLGRRILSDLKNTSISQNKIAIKRKTTETNVRRIKVGAMLRGLIPNQFLEG